jgi:hypothetical protein
MKRLNFVLCVVCWLLINSVAHAATIRTVALSGQQAPGAPDGVTFGPDFNSIAFGIPVLNDDGQTAFVANLSGNGVDFANDQGIWSEGSGNLALVAREGEQAPGAQIGTYWSFAFLKINRGCCWLRGIRCV